MAAFFPPGTLSTLRCMSATRPDVILFLTDDQGYGDIEERWEHGFRPDRRAPSRTDSRR